MYIYIYIYTGFYPSSTREQLWCDELIDTNEELAKVFRPIWFEPAQEKRAASRRALVESGQMDQMLTKMEDMIARRKDYCGAGWYAYICIHNIYACATFL